MKRHTQPVLHCILILTVTLIFPSFNGEAAGLKTSLNKLAQQPIPYTRSPNIIIPSNTPAQYVPDEILVKFKSEFKSAIKIGTANKGVPVPGIASIDNLNLRFGVYRMERVFKTPGKRINKRNNGVSSKDDADFSTTYRLKLKKGGSVPEAVAAYQADPHIEYAEPNYMYYTFEAPEDPYFSSQWALHNEGQTGGTLDADIDVPEAWNIETGSPDVVIAIVDTGVDWDHPDLGTNIWINSGEDLNGNGIVDDSDFNNIDDDGNGFVDDIRGWDFVTASSEIIAPGEEPGPEDNDPMDFYGHGTHCAGIAGAVSNNWEGISGVAWNCRLMAVRAGYKNIGGLGSLNSADIANGIVYAADNGADIISMSFGESTSSNTIMNAVDHAYISGVTLVGAAGNSDSMEQIYPAAYDNVVAVAATDHNDQRSIWTYQASSYGSWVDAAAPGSSIYSTLFDNVYGYKSGTSMACPLVAGIVGLILSKNPGFTNEEVMTIIRSTTDSITTDHYIGTGRVNAYQALQRDATAIASLDPSQDDITVRGVMEITGTTRGDTFAGYEVLYGSSIYPSDWAPIASSSYPVYNDLLASFDTGLVSDGVYTIRLKVTDTNGYESEDRAIITVDNKYISAPQSYTMFRTGKIITIEGGANGANFLRFEVEYAKDGQESDPAAWSSKGIRLTDGGMNPIADGMLATWDTSFVKEFGIYTIRLKVITAEGEQSELVNSICLDPNIKEGWPWQVEDGINAPITVADLDQDGKREVIVCSNDKKAYVWRHDGTLLKGWPQEIESLYSIPSAPAADDIDNDGDLEIVAGAGYDYYAWHSDGTIVNGWPKHLGDREGTTILPSPVISDLNKDGSKEIILSSPDAMVICNSSGEIIKQITVSPYQMYGTPAVGDIDNDGMLEIVALLYDYTYYGKIYCWNNDGSIVNGWPVEVDNDLVASPVLADFNGDGFLEIVVAGGTIFTADNPDARIYMFNHDGSLVSGWPFEIGLALVWGSPAIADLENDGDLEIIIGTGTSVYGNASPNVFALHHDGTLVDGWPKETWTDTLQSRFVFTSPIIADFNNNGTNEVALISDESLISDKYCLFWAWYHDGQIIPDWPKNFGAANVRYASPAIADLDNDKVFEIVAGRSDGFIYVWNLPESKGKGTISWPMFQHDSRHTGLYSQPPLNNQPSDIPSTPSPDVAEERVITPATLTWNGGDPDGKKDTVDYFIYLNEGECGSQVEPATLIGTIENVPGDKIKIHYKTSQLNPCACYYWQVVARDSTGAEANGPVWCYRVKKDGCVDCPSAPPCQ